MAVLHRPVRVIVYYMGLVFTSLEYLMHEGDRNVSDLEIRNPTWMPSICQGIKIVCGHQEVHTGIDVFGRKFAISPLVRLSSPRQEILATDHMALELPVRVSAFSLPV